MRKVWYWVGALVAMIVGLLLGSGVYMLRYPLAPEGEREDTARCFRRLVEQHPEVTDWIDSLRRADGLRDRS